MKIFNWGECRGSNVVFHFSMGALFRTKAVYVHNKIIHLNEHQTDVVKYLMFQDVNCKELRLMHRHYTIGKVDNEVHFLKLPLRMSKELDELSRNRKITTIMKGDVLIDVDESKRFIKMDDFTLESTKLQPEDFFSNEHAREYKLFKESCDCGADGTELLEALINDYGSGILKHQQVKELSNFAKLDYL